MIGVDIDRMKFALTEYRSVVSEDMTVKTKYPLSSELEYNTLISSETDAQNFGLYVLGLRKLDRNSWQCLLAERDYDFDVGDTITLFYPRFGFDAGKNFIVKRLKRSANSLFHELSLYGPQ